ncbi:MAG: hypothetical protein ACKOZW_10990 [Cyanobium sp.]
MLLLLVGFVTAALSSWQIIAVLLACFKQHSTLIFAGDRLLFGIWLLSGASPDCGGSRVAPDYK